jgi:uncharacterized membrane protein
MSHERGTAGQNRQRWGLVGPKRDRGVLTNPKHLFLMLAIAAVGLSVAIFLIVSSKEAGPPPIIPLGLGFFAAYIAVRRKDA